MFVGLKRNKKDNRNKHQKEAIMPKVLFRDIEAFITRARTAVEGCCATTCSTHGATTAAVTS